MFVSQVHLKNMTKLYDWPKYKDRGANAQQRQTIRKKTWMELHQWHSICKLTTFCTKANQCMNDASYHCTNISNSLINNEFFFKVCSTSWHGIRTVPQFAKIMAQLTLFSSCERKALQEFHLSPMFHYVQTDVLYRFYDCPFCYEIRWYEKTFSNFCIG